MPDQKKASQKLNSQPVGQYGPAAFLPLSEQEIKNKAWSQRPLSNPGCFMWARVCFGTGL